MTSTEFSIGLKEGARASSKVLKPPGGGSSNIFGFTEHGFQTPKKEIFKDVEAKNEANLYTPNSSSKIVVRYDTITGEKIEMNMKIDDEDDKVKRNPITGEVVSTMPKDIQVIQQDEPKKHSAITTSIRVRNPPGGKSSGIF